MVPEKVTPRSRNVGNRGKCCISLSARNSTASGSSQSLRSSRSSRSSLRLAKAIAKQVVARLHIRQLQEQRLLEEKEFKLKQQREVLKASHQLQKAALKDRS